MEMEKASKLLKTVYQEHINRFGEPDSALRFGGKEPLSGEEHIPDFIDILVWEPDEDIDIITFATVGMSDKPMPGAAHRAEVHFAVRGNYSREEISKTAAFLANIAVYPFLQNTSLDWLQLLSDPGEIPSFTEAEFILLHPEFVEGGWATIEEPGEELVKILNVVPITGQERDIMKTNGFDALCDFFEKQKIDLLTRR